MAQFVITGIIELALHISLYTVNYSSRAIFSGP
jgi:hypothetical protein